MSQREEVIAKIIERGAPLFGMKPEDMNENMRFAEDLKAKSTNISQITTFLEDEFDIEVPYMQFRRKATIGEAADFVCELLDE